MPSHRQLFLLRTSGRFRRTGCAVGRQSRQFLPLWQRVHAGSKTWLCSRLNHTLFFSSSGISPNCRQTFWRPIEASLVPEADPPSSAEVTTHALYRWNSKELLGEYEGRVKAVYERYNPDRLSATRIYKSRPCLHNALFRGLLEQSTTARTQ